VRLARRQVAILVLVATTAYLGSGFACGSSSAIKSFRLALISSTPLVNSLVAAGAIPQTRATAIIADFDAGAACALTLQSEFAAIPDDLTDREKTAQKLNASVRALRCWRDVINRQNFAAHARVKQVVDIADGILASMVVFYSEPGEMRASTEPAASVKARDEKDLERQLKAQVEELKAAMKP
jgi:hypothetical protein